MVWKARYEQLLGDCCSTYHLPPTTYHLPPTTYHLPPTAYRLPPTAYHLPPTTYHLPPTTYSSSSARQVQCLGLAQSGRVCRAAGARRQISQFNMGAIICSCAAGARSRRCLSAAISRYALPYSISHHLPTACQSCDTHTPIIPSFCPSLVASLSISLSPPCLVAL